MNNNHYLTKITSKKSFTYKYALLVYCLFVSCNIFAGTISQDMINDDVETLRNIRHSLDLATDFMNNRNDLFIPDKVSRTRLTTREQRNEIWLFWQSLLDRILIIDSIGSKYDNLYRYSSSDEKKQLFSVSYAAFLMQYRYMLTIITKLENDPSMHTMLNEPVPELDLDKGLYTKLKFRFLNVARVAELIRLNSIYSIHKADENFPLTQTMSSDISTLFKFGLGSGTEKTYKNALKIIEDTGFTVWFPTQKTVSEWMGDVKVLRNGHSLMSKKQINDIAMLLHPGDIILERREWYLSNIGLPGYWPHAALYIGTQEHRKEYFNDMDAQNEYGSAEDFEEKLKSSYSVAYLNSITKDDKGQTPSIIEAVSEGVSFTTLEHSIAADSVAILRPRVSKYEKAKAIERAFHYSGRPYDFNFDFLTDAELVCTELVYKAYEPMSNYKGIQLPTRKIMGKSVTTANDIAQLYDTEFGTTQHQLDLIAFYDGHERMQSAIKSNSEVFRNSWRRPKLYIWIQDTPLAK